MKATLLVVVLWALALPHLFAENAPTEKSEDSYLNASDRLSFQGKDQASIDLLEKSLTGVTAPEEQAEIYWRLSRDTLHLADEQRSSAAGAPARQGEAATSRFLAMYKQGEAYADQAISRNPSSAKGYFWKAANIGRWGQTRGIIASLFQADPMRQLLVTAARLDPSLGEVWLVLGQLYSQVPGFPLSFGNAAWAVSLGRKAIDARTAELRKGLVPNVPEEYFIQLANELARRDWSAAKRQAEHEAEAQQFSLQNDPLDKNFYYEGTIPIPNLSDRREAIDLVQKAINNLLDTPKRTALQNEELKEAQTDLYDWTTPPSF